VERTGAEAVNLRLVDPIDLARMLAKVSYSFAVGCLGLDIFEEVYVLPTILDGPNAGHYVGCLQGPLINNQAEGHQVTLVRTPREVTTYIRLFAEMDLPEYTVVVGRLRGAGTGEAVASNAAVCGCQRTQSAMTSPLAMPLFWLVYRALKPMMLTI
jgi:hypothetical protein